MPKLKLFYHFKWYILCVTFTFGALQPLQAKGNKTFKVISLSPNTTAIIHDVIEIAKKNKQNMNTKLIASIYYPGQPTYYQNYQNIGSFQALNVEKILSLKPDLVISWQGQTQPQVLALLRRFEIKIAVFNANTLTALADSFAEIGESIQLKQAGMGLKQDFLKSLAAIMKEKAFQSNTKPPSVLLQLAKQPIFVAGGSGILNDIIHKCGGVNSFQEINKISFETSISAIIQKNPSVIVMLSCLNGWFVDANTMWQSWQNLAAVKNKHIFQLATDEISQFSPQILSGVKNICDILRIAG